jgi:hypothetical protein
LLHFVLKRRNQQLDRAIVSGDGSEVAAKWQIQADYRYTI